MSHKENVKKYENFDRQSKTEINKVALLFQPKRLNSFHRNPAPPSPPKKQNKNERRYQILI